MTAGRSGCSRSSAEQVKAIQNLKIDKITVWDSGRNGDAAGGGEGSTAGFLKGLIGSLPPMHELAEQAGIDLPEVLGRIQPSTKARRAEHDGAAGENEGDGTSE